MVTQPNSQQGFPKPDAPMVSSDGRPSYVWYRFLSNLWKQLGAGLLPIGTIAIIQPLGSLFNIVSTATGMVLGQVVTSLNLPISTGALLGNSPTVGNANVVTLGANFAISSGTLTLTGSVTDLVAGSGIGLSPSPIVNGSGTISNTGVMSFDGRTGAVTLGSSDISTALGYTPLKITTAGTNITVNAGGTISASGGGGSVTPGIGLITLTGTLNAIPVWWGA